MPASALLMPLVVSWSPPNLCSLQTSLASLPRHAAGFAGGEPLIAGREDGDAPGAHGDGGGSRGGGGNRGLHRNGGSYQERRGFGALPPSSAPPVGVGHMPLVELQQQQQQELHDWLLEDVGLFAPDLAEGCGQPALEDSQLFQDWTPAVSDDGSLFETTNEMVGKLGVM